MRTAAALKEHFQPLDEHLDAHCEDLALMLFRAGFDTVDIGWKLECTQAAAANGMARARDRERASR
jgi:uncharacterized protein Smg (DUF494 family)